MKSRKFFWGLILPLPAVLCGQTTAVDLRTQSKNPGVTAVTSGGTGASTPAAARANLGLGEAATKPVSGGGDRVPTQSGPLPQRAIPTPDSGGSLIDSGCTAADGGLTCGSGAPTRIGVRQGAAPSDTSLNDAVHDAVLYVDSADGILKLRKADGTVLFLSFSPTIGSFANAPHTHADAVNGGTLGPGAFGAGALSGNGSKLATTAGTLVSGNCVRIDAGGNFVDSGAVCGGGGEGGSLGFTPLDAAANLADLASPASARANLGLGAAATRSVQGNGASVLGFAGAVPAVDTLAVYDANGNAAGNMRLCRVAPSGVVCGGGADSAALVLPETAAGGHGTDSRIYGAGSQATSGCVVWPVGNPSAGQAAVDSGASAPMTDGRVCRVLAWQTPAVSPAGPSDAIQKNSGAGSLAAAVAGTDYVAPSSATTYSPGIKQTFQPSAATAGQNVACAALPASPSIGDIACDSADGNTLKHWNGSSWSAGSAATAGLDCSDPANLCVVEPFFSTSNSNTYVGALGWTVSFGTIGSTSGEQKHWGIYTLATGATPNAAAGLELSGTSGSKSIPSLTTATNWTIVWKFKTPADINEWQMYVGLQTTALSSAFPPTNGLWLRYGSSAGCANNLADSTWMFVANNAGGTTAKDSGHSIAPATWYWVRFRNTGTAGVVAMSIKADGESWSVEQTMSVANGDYLYNGIQLPTIKHQTCNTTARTAAVDEFRATLTGLN